MDRREEAFALLKPQQTVHLATWDGERPRVRPMSLVYQEERFWMCTGSKDAKAGQLASYPVFEFSLMLEGQGCRGTLRGSGIVRLVTDPDEKRRVAGLIPFFGDYWKSSDDPTFCPMELVVDTMEHMRPGEMHSEVFKV
jgi:uncharacterized pyridoxamine 5'-phosphate oxidase family protein